MSPQELDKEHHDCNLCGRATGCTWLKTAHIPIYAWVCDKCRDKWVRE